MFCPNCGTQNPETAQVCSKCAFALKNKAAPKFKGTMLMVNPPTGAAGTAPKTPLPAGPGAAPPGAQLPSPAGALRGPAGLPSKLQGTIVGVAPPMMHASPPPPAAGASAARGGAPDAPTGFGAAVGATLAFSPGGQKDPAPPGGPSAYSPHEPRGGYVPQEPRAPVNPLGGTVSADAAAYAAAFAPHPATSAAVGPAQATAPAYGGAGQTIALGASPAGFGQAPYGAPGSPAAPAGYGAPGAGVPQASPGLQGPRMGEYDPRGQAPAPLPAGVPAAYPPGAYGQPPGAMVPVGLQPMAPYAPALAGTLQSRGAFAGSGPTRRNALMTWLLPVIVIVAGGTVSLILSMVVPVLALLAPVAVLAGSIWLVVLAIRMALEVGAVTRNGAFAWWPLFVPIYHYYWAWILVPQEVAKAKQILGIARPPQSIVLYIFLWHFALATDLNEMVR